MRSLKMESAAVVKYDQYKKLVKQSIFFVLFQIVTFALLWEQFVFPYGQLIVIGVVMMEVLCTIVWIFLSKRMITLDADGITVISPLGKNNYPWSDVREYHIETVLNNSGQAVIQVIYSSPRKKINIPCREDTLYWVQRYCGVPSYDQR